MRIIAGKFRGRVLAEFRGDEVRPTADRVKESLFNILGLAVREARVLDLFAGSGALGLECLSRGAKQVVFNDVSKDSVAILRKNLRALKLDESGQAVVSQKDYRSCLDGQSVPFDLIFLDPPYRFDYADEALSMIAKKGLLEKDGVVVYERDKPFDGSVDGLQVVDVRRYGKAVLTFLRKSE